MTAQLYEFCQLVILGLDSHHLLLLSREAKYCDYGMVMGCRDRFLFYFFVLFCFFSFPWQWATCVTGLFGTDFFLISCKAFGVTARLRHETWNVDLGGFILLRFLEPMCSWCCNVF